MRISDWSSDVCSSDLAGREAVLRLQSCNRRGDAGGQPGGKGLAVDQVGFAGGPACCAASQSSLRSEEHTSELQSLMRISYAVFCLKKNKEPHTTRMNSSS